MVTGACAGVHGSKLTIVRHDGVPEASEFKGGSVLDRFFRHDGGPVTISAISRIGKLSATGVRIRPIRTPGSRNLRTCRNGRPRCSIRRNGASCAARTWRIAPLA